MKVRRPARVFEQTTSYPIEHKLDGFKCRFLVVPQCDVILLDGGSLFFCSSVSLLSQDYVQLLVWLGDVSLRAREIFLLHPPATFATSWLLDCLRLCSQPVRPGRFLRFKLTSNSAAIRYYQSNIAPFSLRMTTISNTTFTTGANWRSNNRMRSF